MKIYTIGFTKKTAEQFFKLLTENNVRKVMDIRLNNKSQLSVFARFPDIKYFLKLHNIEYVHNKDLAPTEDLRKKYNNKKLKMSFDEYSSVFNETMKERGAILKLKVEELDGICFLCSEALPNECHRRLVVEAISKLNPNIKIIHL